ncbi:hypothetical protein HCU40_09075 [Pseudanabaena biceps]|nr:hypothetical protein [Pseudanabaena biceps]
MPRFQSRLFNWIDRSLPAQLGRKARRSLDQKIGQIVDLFSGLNFQELPRLLAYQVARAALYPVYLISSNVKRNFPALDRSKDEARQSLRSQESAGLLSESKINSDEIENFKESTENQVPNIPLTEPPLLLRPLVKFLNWIDRTKIKLDRNITALVKSPSNRLANIRHPNSSQSAPSKRDLVRISNRIFAEIWQQQTEQNNNAQDRDASSLKENNGLAEVTALGKNDKLEQLRRLIEAAIAYFFGSQASSSSDPENNSLSSDLDNLELKGIETSQTNSLSDDPKLKHQKIKPSRNPPALGDRLLNRKSSSDNLLSNQVSTGEIAEKAPLATSNLERLRDLIAAAIDYFISKRSLGRNESNQLNGNQNLQSIQQSSDTLERSPAKSPDVSLNEQDTESSSSLQLDDQLDRLRKLIADAIDYFFGNQRSASVLEETSEIEVTESAWLTMEDLFGDDNGPWPLPLEYESVAFTKSPDLTALNSSGELQSFETTTSQLSQDLLEGGLIFEENLLEYQQAQFESDRPLRAWIEANATILGYAYNPMMTVIFWFDELVLKIENLIIAIWKKLISIPKRLLKSPKD